MNRDEVIKILFDFIEEYRFYYKRSKILKPQGTIRLFFSIKWVIRLSRRSEKVVHNIFL